MLEKIKGFINEHDMLKKEDYIIAGVSGGADSVCLLFVLLELQKEIDFRLQVVHVNHGLRGKQADEDEQFVRELCEQQGIPFVNYFEDVELLAKKWKQSTEEAGRNFRRTCFEKTMKAVGGTKIALAHHKNDSVETLLMNLARGTGLKGMGGIAPIQGDTIRPLLCLEREEIEAYLKERNISYRTDETNESDAYTRNRIRNHLIPYMEEYVNEKTVSHIGTMMDYMREVHTYLDEQATVSRLNCTREMNQGILIESENFSTVPKVLQPVILKQVLSLTAGQEKDLEAVHVKVIKELFEKQVGRKLDLPYHMEARRVYEGVLVAKKQEDAVGEWQEICFDPDVTEYELGRYRITCRIFEKDDNEKYLEKSGTKWFDYDIIKGDISFRTRRPGDYITIHDDGRTQKLKTYFINEKISNDMRDEVLLVAEGKHILWICGYRDNCAYRVKEHTKRVLEIRVAEGEESWQKQSEY